MKKFLKFLSTGFLTYGLSLGLTYVFVEMLFWSQFFAYLWVLLLITGINFFLATRYIFQVEKRKDIFLRYMVFLLFFTVINYFATTFFTQLFGEKYFYIVIFFITTGIFFAKFFIYDRYVFKK